MITHILHGSHCGSDAVIRYGKAANGWQRYRCHTCSHTSRDDSGTRAYAEERKAEILAAYHERTSLRGLTRIFGARAQHCLRLAEGRGRGVPPLEETVALAEPGDVLELDELWSFVGHTESGGTNHVECWNLTMRQRLGRFVRKTLSFSKCDDMYEICLRLLLDQYNLSRA